MSGQPFTCGRCGQRGDERPGFKREPTPEAVGTLDGMLLVDAFRCLRCQHLNVVAAGAVEVRKSPADLA